MRNTRRAKRKPINTRWYFWSVVLALLLLIGVTSQRREHLSGLESVVGTLLSPFQKVTAVVTGGVQSLGDRLFGAPELRSENDRLTSENAKLSEENRRLLEVVAKADYLKNEAALMESSEKPLLPATVIGKESGGLFIRFTIDRGTNDKVHTGDLVVLGVETPEGPVATTLVGRITESAASWSRVTGILDETTNLSFKNVRTQQFGVLNSRTSVGLTGYLFDVDADVLIGDSIVTSGLTPLYPPNLYIGKVTQFETSEHDRMKHVTVETGVDFSRLYRVMVLQQTEDAQ